MDRPRGLTADGLSVGSRRERVRSPIRAKQGADADDALRRGGLRQLARRHHRQRPRPALSYFLISLGALAASSYIFSQLDPLHPQFQVFAFLLGFVGITYFGWLPLFLPELFPTRVRSTGTGISFNTGRVVAAVVVLSAGFLLDQFSGDYARVGFWSGMIYARRDGRDLVRAATSRRATGGLTWSAVGVIGLG